MSSEELKKLAPYGKVKLTIEYDGTNFRGWQRQGQGVPSIQQAIEESLARIFDKSITLIGAGRTDAGVHAENQVAHFIAPKEVATYNFVHLFQGFLPPDITIKKAELVPAHFHAQKSATSKTYVYRVWNNPGPSALRAKRSLWIRKPLNIERLNRVAQVFVGAHDFNAFRSEGSAVKSTIRTINSAHVGKKGDYVEFTFNGNGFLKQMVRNMVGTLLQLEIGSRTEESIPELLKDGRRIEAGPAVEPQGLYLSQVYYPDSLTDLDNYAPSR